MRVFARHGCGNQNVDHLSRAAEPTALEQHIRARHMKAGDTGEVTSLYGNTPAGKTSTFARVLAAHLTHLHFPHAHPL
ncbi:hypothetical protein QBC32DRAFT_197131, partial [Pseudoneurospora amorphoporcata]